MIARPARVVIAGAGIAGLTAALLLSRAGLRVRLVEGDAAGPPADPDASLTGWPRPGVPQLGHSHTIHALAHRILRRQLADVLARLVALGAQERTIGCLPSIPPALRDPDLVVLLTRRSLLEWVLREAVEASDVTVLAGERVVGLRVADAPCGGREVAAVRLAGGGTLDADWVVDATGRTSKLGHWLGELGIGPGRDSSQPSATNYYGRHFRLRPGSRAPAGPWILGPSGDLGYLRFSLLPEDSDGYVVTINPTGRDRAFKALREVDVWQAAAAAIPALRDWVTSDVAQPISGVYAMGGLRNRLRNPYDDPDDTVAGLLCIGDALCHTDPVQGWGVSLAMDHSVRVAGALAGDHGGKRERTRRLLDELVAATWPYYDIAAGEDRDRARIADGEPVDWTNPGAPLFCRNIVYPVSGADPELYLAVQRRVHLLDPASALLDRQDLVDRARRLHAQRPAAPAAPAPSRGDLLAELAAAAGTLLRTGG